MLGVKMKYIEAWTESRRKNAARYNEGLAGSVYHPPIAPANLRHVYHVYAVRHPKRDALMAYLNTKGIQSGIHYPIPVHLQKCFSELGLSATALDLDACAMARPFARGGERTTALLELGAQTSRVCLTRGPDPVLVRVLPAGGESLLARLDAPAFRWMWAIAVWASDICGSAVSASSILARAVP